MEEDGKPTSSARWRAISRVNATDKGRSRSATSAALERDEADGVALEESKTREEFCDVSTPPHSPTGRAEERLHGLEHDVLQRWSRGLGRRIDSLLAERVYGPIGCATRGSILRRRSSARRAHRTQTSRRSGVGRRHDENAWDARRRLGARWLFSSARDLAVYAQMMLNGGSRGLPVFRPETVAPGPDRQTKVASRALGWDTPSPRSSAWRYFSPRSFVHTGFTGPRSGSPR